MDEVLHDENLIHIIFTFCNKICLLKLNSINKIWSRQIPSLSLFKAGKCLSQEDLISFVLLPAEKIKKYPYEIKKEGKNGTLILYSLQKVLPMILKDHGGWEGIEQRHQKRVYRLYRSTAILILNHNEEAEIRAKKLKAILSILRLSPRKDSVIQKEYIEMDKHDIEKVVFTACYMHWLHDYTEYSEHLTAAVHSYAKDVGYYKGIYRDMSELLQKEDDYQPPKRWPWLSGSKYESTEAAIRYAINNV